MTGTDERAAMLLSSILARGAVSVRRHPERLDAALSGLFLLLWTSGFSVVKIGLETVPPLTFLALRYVCVVALLLPVQLTLRLPLPRARRNWFDLGLVGFLIQFVYFSGIYIALQLGLSAGAVALIVSLQPILVGIFAPLWVGESVSRRQWFGLALGFIGAGVVIVAKARIEATSWAGIGFALVALLGITLGLLYEKKTSASVHPIVSTLTQTGEALLLLLPCILIFESGALESGAIRWSGGLFFSLAYLAFGNSLIAIILLFYLARRRSAVKLSSLFFLVPPGAAGMAILLTGETMPWLAWTGIGLTAFGVWLAHR